MQAAQAVHAAFALSVEYSSEISEWHRTSNYLVLLGSRDLTADLFRLEEHGCTLIRCYEPDLPDAPLTAFAVLPSPEVGRLLASLPLALKEPAMVS